MSSRPRVRAKRQPIMPRKQSSLPLGDFVGLFRSIQMSKSVLQSIAYTNNFNGFHSEKWIESVGNHQCPVRSAIMLDREDVLLQTVSSVMYIMMPKKSRGSNMSVFLHCSIYPVTPFVILSLFISDSRIFRAVFAKDNFAQVKFQHVRCKLCNLNSAVYSARSRWRVIWSVLWKYDEWYFVPQ